MSTNPYTPPSAAVENIAAEGDVEYAGFWIRVGASLIDTVVILVVTWPILGALYGWTYFSQARSGFFAGPADFAISWLLPAAGVIAFWLSSKQGTPGKMAVSARIVDAKTGGKLSVGQSLVRYLGYFVSTLPLGLGLIWVGFDPRKQGWHDKLAGTVVVRSKSAGTRPVVFEKR